MILHYLYEGGFYLIVFLSTYIQVFFLVTFLEKGKQIVRRNGPTDLEKCPTVTIIVPCWNEEATIYRTVRSLLALDYPKNKIDIFLVDDGSTDNTWNVMKRFQKYSNIKIFQKENGGKHTAVNFGIENSKSEFIGCLDADSFVDSNALKRIMTYFEKNKEIMAVSPSIIVHNPKSIIQKLQKIEYNWAVFNKKMLAFLGGIHVTPGPFSIYKRKVFEQIGVFRKAHNTEDMEIAFRMQKNHLKIEQCNDAYVYTVAPNTVIKLYKQRLRWVHGFMRNTIDYRGILFRKNYGAFSWFTVPSGIISVITVPYMLGIALYSTMNFVFSKIQQFSVGGINYPILTTHIDPFFINTKPLFFMSLVLYGLILGMVLIGKKMAEGKTSFSFSIIYFMIVYSVIAPFWVMKSFYNVIFAKKTSWR